MTIKRNELHDKKVMLSPGVYICFMVNTCIIKYYIILRIICQLSLAPFSSSVDARVGPH